MDFCEPTEFALDFIFLERGDEVLRRGDCSAALSCFGMIVRVMNLVTIACGTSGFLYWVDA
jgi:hypothetical protein